MLDKQSIKILKFIGKYDFVTLNQLKTKFNGLEIGNYLNHLVNEQYISGTSVPYIEHNYFTKEVKENSYIAAPYKITPKGEAYTQSRHDEYKKEIKKAIITVLTTAVLSNIDRIIGVIANLISLLSHTQ